MLLQIHVPPPFPSTISSQPQSWETGQIHACSQTEQQEKACRGRRNAALGPFPGHVQPVPPPILAGPYSKSHFSFSCHPRAGHEQRGSTLLSTQCSGHLSGLWHFVFRSLDRVSPGASTSQGLPSSSPVFLSPGRITFWAWTLWHRSSTWKVLSWKQAQLWVPELVWVKGRGSTEGGGERVWEEQRAGTFSFIHSFIYATDTDRNFR